MEHGCGIRFCLQTLAGVGGAEVVWVVSQAMQATFLLFHPSPVPMHKAPEHTEARLPAGDQPIQTTA